MTIPDPLADIREILLADAGVMALVEDGSVPGGGRVFHSELPDSESPNMPRQSVIVSQAGGAGRAKTLKTRSIRLDTHCYGATLYESWQLHLVVREAVETLARRSNSVISVETVSDGQNARDPLKQWPVCLASYRVLTTTTV